MSSNQDENIAQIVSQTLSTVGLQGVINMTESPTGDSRFGLISGLFLERGFVSELFIEQASPSADKQNTTQNVVELEKPLVLVVADKITKVS